MEPTDKSKQAFLVTAEVSGLMLKSTSKIHFKDKSFRIKHVVLILL
jgi:hypothetical protein